MDAVFLYRPEMDGQPGRFETFFKATDLVEKNVLTHITGLVMGMDAKTYLFPGKKEEKDRFMKHITELTQNLFNSNLHRRNYKTKEMSELKRFRKESVKNKNKHLDIYENPTELWVEFNGFLTSLRSSLDSLAVSLGSLLNLSIHGWHTEKDKVDGKKKSGQNIINILKRNTPKEKAHIIESIVRMIEKEITWITYLATLRDNIVHYGGLKNVSKLRFEQKSREIVGQIITHQHGFQEPVETFMRRAIDTIVDFSHKVLVAVMHTRVNGLVLGKVVQENGDTTYKWFSEQVAKRLGKQT